MGREIHHHPRRSHGRERRLYHANPNTEGAELLMNVEDIVREGTVTAVDNDKRIAKVWYDALGITSDWLPVLINQHVIHYYPYDAEQWTEFDAEDETPQSGETRYVRHRHKVIIKPWMPKVNDKVLVLYFPVFNGDGVILGGVQPWR